MTSAWAIEATRIPAPYNPALLGYAPQQARQPIQASNAFRQSVAKIWCCAVGNTDAVAAGTGVFITKNVLLTVGHVLFDARQFGLGRCGGYVDHVSIESQWLGLVGLSTNRVVAAPDWTAAAANAGSDLGVIKLDQPVASAIPVTPQAVNDASLSGQAISVCGYPGINNQLFDAHGRCLALSSELIFHNADVEDGESGSPLFTAGASVKLAGLHRAGPGSTPSGYPDSVSAFRFTPEAIDWVKSVIPLL